MVTDLYSKRYSDQQLQEELNVATILDPRFKQVPYLSDEDRYTLYNKISVKAASLPLRAPVPVKVKMEVNITPGTPALPELPVKQEPSTSTPSSLLEDILGEVFVTKVEPAKSPMEQSAIEIADYRALRQIQLKDNPLDWWKMHEFQFPMLARMAKVMLCVTATSVPSERVFSTAGDIITHERSTLKPKNVDMLIFLKKNM